MAGKISLQCTYLFILLWMTTTNALYLLTLPRVMEADKDTYFCLVLNDIDDLKFGFTADIEIKHVHADTNATLLYIYKVSTTAADIHTCTPTPAPGVPGQYRTQVLVKTVVNDDYTNANLLFESSQDIIVNKPDLITLIQTDKPIYKPGQMVKFRVMTMDYTLLAKTDGYSQISIESPNGMRVMQWDDVTTENGLVSLQMQLSSDPVLGAWLIKVNDGDRDVTQSFTVDEYVLPKFEVTVTPPTYLLPTTQQISGTVCATYTYGKPVKGTLKMDLCYSPYYYSDYYPTRPCAAILSQIDGCYEFFVSADEIKLGHKGYSSWGELRINASVTEEATGIELLGKSKGPSLSHQILSLKLEDDSDNYFKPGFPYKGRVVVTNPDGSPAPGEEILVNVDNYMSEYIWSQTFSTDENGLVNFAITEIEGGIGNLQIRAEAVFYDDWRYSDGDFYFRTWAPSAYASLTKWYSPSNSYLYIPDIDGAVDCDSDLVFDVFYSTPPMTHYKFQVLVKAGDRLVHSHSETNIFDGTVVDLDILSIEKSSLLEKKKKPTRPPLPTIRPTILPDGSTPALPVEEEEAEVFDQEEEMPVIEETIVPEVAQTLGQETPRKKREADSTLIAHFKMSIPVSQEMSPGAKILVFYLRDDKEIVASTIEFKIKNCFRNKARMTFDADTVRPGTNVNLTLEASPSSTCFVGMVDKSVNLLGGKNQLTPTEVFENVRRVARQYSYISWWSEDRDYCEKVNPSPEKEVADYYYYGYSSPEGVDATQAFRDANMWVITDGVLESRPCSERRQMMRYYDSPVPMPMIGNQGPMGMTDDIEVQQMSPGTTEAQTAPVEQIRSFFPETWLWDMFKVGDDGQVMVPTKIPDTITEWVGNSLCTHPVDGVGVSEIVGVTAFQPFFLSFTLPYSAIRGEVLPVLMTVFNYLPNCLTMEVTLNDAEGFEFSSGGGNSRQFCLCGGESESTKFHIIPTIVGEIDIEGTAVSMENSGLCNNVILSEVGIGVTDGVQRQLLIEAEGVPQEVTESSYVCVEDKNMISSTVDMSLPEDLVLDSARATVSVIGDLMGPTLSNLKNLLRMPYGCGEQNMASWSPNIYVLQYLTYTSQLTDKLEEEAKGYMRVGYQRQMKYRHSDNSYSAWGDNEYGNATGSLWLTAFVVKSMATSTPFITIDPADITRSATWFTKKQLPNTGCFPQVGKVFSSYMKGGLANGENPAGLTAFVLIAMLEGNLGTNEDFHASISKGFLLCLDSFPTADMDTYTLAVMSYAYTLYDLSSQRRTEILQELENRKKTDVGEYWSRDDTDKKEEPERRWHRASSAEVEMTAYVLLSRLAEGSSVLGRTLPIVKWLTKQRNRYGGFSSTQDTVVALQALARYASLTYSGTTNVKVEVKNNALDQMFTVIPSNSLLFQSESVNPDDGPIAITTSGSGCAMVQVSMKYNVYKEEEDGPAFDVDVHVFRSSSKYKNCAFRILEVCASYLKAGGASNMAIVEVKMPTGWTPVTSSLDTLTKKGKIQKYEVDKNYVELYFDGFTRSRVCVNLEVEQEIEMNPKPAMVRVYDYYETNFAVTATYEIKTTCGTKEEIPLDNEGLDCNVVQCRVDTPKHVEQMSCPSCPVTFTKDETFEILTCNSEAVYKAIVGRSGQFPIKIKADIRHKKRVMGAFVTYIMGDHCSCPVLQAKDARVLIFTSDLAVLNIQDTEITLNGDVTVVKFSLSLEKRVRNLASKAHLCQKLARLRRSERKQNREKLTLLRSRYKA